MSRAFLLVTLVAVACASKGTVKQDSDERPEIPGGNCFWSIHEGGSECTVESGIESRTRIVADGGDLDIHGVEGYGKKKWKCGESREICGTTVECTCPFPSAGADSGS